MTTQEILSNATEKMEKAIAVLKKEYANVRTGRANPLILERIQVEYYGAPTPLRQLSNVSVQDGQTLVITPFDKMIVNEIEKYSTEYPDFKKKFDTAQVKLLPMITNIWIDCPEACEADFRKLLETLPEKFTMDILLGTIGKYKNGISKPPTKYLLNLSAYPWDLDCDANLMFCDWDLTKD